MSARLAWLARAGWLAYVALLPVMVVRGLPGLGAQFQLCDAVALALVAVAASAWRALRAHGRELAAVQALGAWLGVAACAAIGAAHPRVSALEWIGYAYMAALPLAALATLTTWNAWMRVVRVWVAVSSLVCLIGLIGVGLAASGVETPLAVYYPHLFVIRHPIWVLTSTFFAAATPNMVCGYLQAGLLLAIGLAAGAKTPRARRLTLVAIGLHAVAVALTYSRGWVGIAFALCVWLWRTASPLAARLRPAAVAAAVAFALAVELISVVNITAVSAARQPTAVSPADREAYYYYLDEQVAPTRLRVEVTYAPFARALLRHAALRMAAERPWFGFGPGGFAHELFARQQRGERWWGLRVGAPWDPHSTYLAALAETGVLGLLALLAFFGAAGALVAAAARRAQAPHAALLWALFSCLVGYAVLGWNEDLLTKRWFWMMLALGISGAALARPKGARA